jgi:hypothetical protein
MSVAAALIIKIKESEKVQPGRSAFIGSITGLRVRIKGNASKVHLEPLCAGER